jgi:hypothetical protein
MGTRSLNHQVHSRSLSKSETLYKELGFTHRRDVLFPVLRLTDTPPVG